MSSTTIVFIVLAAIALVIGAAIISRARGKGSKSGGAFYAERHLDHDGGNDGGSGSGGDGGGD